MVRRVPPLPKDEMGQDSREERLRVLEGQGIRLDVVARRAFVHDPIRFHERIENFVGFACVPIGVIGPLRVEGAHARGDFYVPMATTEGALVASYNRGAKVVGGSGGARVLCLLARVSRTPAFVFRTLREAEVFSRWVEARVDALRSPTATVTRHGHLETDEATIVGNQVHLDRAFTAAAAPGPHMGTLAPQAV